MGAATTVIHGISVGMISTGIPVVIISIGILVQLFLPVLQILVMGFMNVAASDAPTLGITLATDAFGPIAIMLVETLKWPVYLLKFV